jgi:hypothetical protein
LPGDAAFFEAVLNAPRKLLGLDNAATAARSRAVNRRHQKNSGLPANTSA